MQQQNNSKGFSLLELMVSMALGLIVLGSAVQLFKMGMTTTTVVSQRAELQQNMRAATELMIKDISMAGTGLPVGGIQLPNGAGSQLSLFGCDQTGACHIPTSFAYPGGNSMTGIIPGFSTGVEANAVIPSAPGAICSSITIVYVDYNFPLNEYNITFPNPNGTSVNIAPNPIYVPAPSLITDPTGLQVGDLVWLSNSKGNAVGEITGMATAANGIGNIVFANGDALRMNQTGAAAHNIAALTTLPSATAYRLYVVSYYLNVPATPGQLPRLMRQVNGRTPVPVADNIMNIQFAYDSYNTINNPPVLDANQPNPIGVGDTLNMIQKVNISVMGQSLTGTAKTEQNMAMSTSVSARNMTFRDRYQ